MPYSSCEESSAHATALTSLPWPLICGGWADTRMPGLMTLMAEPLLTADVTQSVGPTWSTRDCRSRLYTKIDSLELPAMISFESLENLIEKRQNP